MPRAPGTMGSLVGVGMFGLITYSGGISLYWPLVAAIGLAGVWSAGHVEQIFGHDAPRIVIDEVIGQMITLGFLARSGDCGECDRVDSRLFAFSVFRYPKAVSTPSTRTASPRTWSGGR